MCRCATGLLIVFNDDEVESGGGKYRQTFSCFISTCHLTVFHNWNSPCIPKIGRCAPLQVMRSSHQEIGQSQMSYTRCAVRDVSEWTCKVGGFTALQAPGCWFSDRWKIAPTSNLWTGCNGKGMEMEVDHPCQTSASDPSLESDVCLMPCCCFTGCFWLCSISLLHCFLNIWLLFAQCFSIHFMSLAYFQWLESFHLRFHHSIFRGESRKSSKKGSVCVWMDQIPVVLSDWKA